MPDTLLLEACRNLKPDGLLVTPGTLDYIKRCLVLPVRWQIPRQRPHGESVMPQDFQLSVNGATRRVNVEPDTPLLYILRNDLELNGPRFGCGLSQCGACTVLVDGKATRSCVTPVVAVGAKSVVTLEGLGTGDKLHPLQRAFIAEQAAQCGFCTNGMIVTAKALLDKTPDPTEAQVRKALAANFCRCGTHNRIVRAVLRAAKGAA
jgi:nicotinate dehydrogenase subunit A